MVDAAAIQALKKQIACSTKQAMDLLKNTHGDIEQAIAVFYQENIADIIKRTTCDKETAKQYYDFFNHNKEKAIKKIKELQNHDEFIHQIITTREDKRRYREAGFELYIQSKDNHDYYDTNDDYVFIPVPDCWLISDILAKHCDDFDYTFFNKFNHQAILNIIYDISLLTNDDKKVMQFYQEVIAWFKEKSSPDNSIVMYGNI